MKDFKPNHNLTVDQAKLGLAIGSFLLKQPAIRELAVRQMLPSTVMISALSHAMTVRATLEIAGVEFLTGRAIELRAEDLQFGYHEESVAMSLRGPLFSSLLAGDETGRTLSAVVTEHLIPVAEAALKATGNQIQAATQLALETYQKSLDQPDNRALWLTLTLPLLLRHYAPHAGDTSKLVPLSVHVCQELGKLGTNQVLSHEQPQDFSGLN